MLNKTSTASSLLVATAAGVLMTSVPSFAQVLTGCSNSCSSFGHFQRNRSWNGSENENFNHVRLRIHNRNNNIAVARTRREDRTPMVVEQQQREREKK